MKRLSAVTIIILCVVISACSLMPTGETPQAKILPANDKTNLSNSERVKQHLYQQYGQWKGVKYKMGGLNQKGIDCSGFIYLTYATRLGIELPRTTALQSKIGARVNKNHLRAGDLVFFNTGFTTRHVGIYIENGKFLHASTSKGVMISKLDDYYWKKKYWHARRIKI